MYKTFITLLVLSFSISLGHAALANTTADGHDDNKNQVYKSVLIKSATVNSTELIENSEEAPAGSWAWEESALDMLDSYTPFIFRTKKSADIEQLKVVLSINNKGKLIGFEILSSEVDKGLKERVAHVLRKMPNAMPIPGNTFYNGMDFELIISK